MNIHQDLVAALEALPEKKLITGPYNRNGCYCALGALLRHANIPDVRHGDEYAYIALGYSEEDFDTTIEILRENEHFEGTDEARYDHVMAYAKERA